MATLLLWLLTSAALCVSIFAAFAAYRTSDRSLSKRLAAQSERLQEMQETLDLHAAAMQRERARNNMREFRARKATVNGEPDGSGDQSSGAAATDPETEKDEWTRKTNLAIARGEIRPLGRR